MPRAEHAHFEEDFTVVVEDVIAGPWLAGDAPLRGAGSAQARQPVTVDPHGHPGSAG
jgi:hypothetical protein